MRRREDLEDQDRPQGELPRLRPPWEPPLSLADGSDGRTLASGSGPSAQREMRAERALLVVW